MYEVGGFGYGEQPPPPPPPRRGRGVFSYLAVAVAAGAFGAGAVLAFGNTGGSNTAASSPARTPSSGGISAPPAGGAQPSAGAGTGSGSGAAPDIQAVLNKVAPGLVIINISQGYNAVQAAGTGMVLTASGEVLTNNHVIESSTSISATVVATGQTYQAKVLGYDKTGDIALIQLQGASGLRTISLGDSSAVRQGATVVAMGNAEGRNEIIPAAGHVTGLNQTVTAQDETGAEATETLRGMIETDADIVSGDSGGALANAAGEVIGMNTAGNNGGDGGGGGFFGGGSGIGGSGGSGGGQGFAIPINTALSVVHQIESGTGSSVVSIGYPPFLGIFISGSASSNPQTQAQGLGQSGGFGFTGGCVQNQSEISPLSSIAPVTSGTLVEAVICGQPAAVAGMTAGSVITAVNGQQVGAASSLSAIVSHDPVGSTVSVTWVSPAGKKTTSNLKLIPGPPR